MLTTFLKCFIIILKKEVLKMDESKKDKFVRLAENRMNSALKQIELLGNLSNTNTYDYTDEYVEQIVRTLKNAVSDLEKKYKIDKKNKKFTLR